VRIALAIFACCLVIPVQAIADDDSDERIAEITVTGQRVANTSPAGSYASPVTVLRYDPATELQSRGLPEGQADIGVRGGLFENTGFKIGAVTIPDPQTGHYSAELPLDPAFLSSPSVLTGIANTMEGFNSNVATVLFMPSSLRDGGSLLVGAGNDNLEFQTLHAGASTMADSGAVWGAAVSFGRSEGDGSVPFGDHDFERYSLQLQRRTDGRQSDLMLGYQDKFYGWPGAYTGFATLAETDRTHTTLVLANHREELNTGFLEIGGFYRRLVDDYDFDRSTQESGEPGSFDHETRVYGVGFNGIREGDALDWEYAGQLTADELVYSTDLTGGDFNSRNAGTLSIVPSHSWATASEVQMHLKFGVRADWSNKDASALSPVIGWAAEKTTADGKIFWNLEYAGASQLPGYTALKSPPAGLFGGNPDLGRERTRQLSITFGKQADDWNGTVTAFYRQDDDLVDWTYASGAPYARQANPVDIDVAGIEAVLSREWRALELIAGYTFIDKDAEYGSAVVDASFYALNFARHRATLALRYPFTDRLELRLDSEFRQQQQNPLRSSSDQALHVSAALAWEPTDGKGFGFLLAADNLTDDDYQQFPGTPALGRQVSLSARYAW